MRGERLYLDNTLENIYKCYRCEKENFLYIMVEYLVESRIEEDCVVGMGA
jgi:hypothetical protein